MRRILLITILLLIILGGVTGAPFYKYKIQWDENNTWLNNNTQRIPWSGFTGRATGTLGVQREDSQTPPPIPFSSDLLLVITSEPQLTTFRLTKIDDPTKYFLPYLTFDKMPGNQYNNHNSAKAIPIELQGGSWWGGNFYLNVYSKSGSDAGYEGIYTTYFRFRLYPKGHLLDDDYLLLDETLHYSLIYLEGGLQGGIVTALVANPSVTQIDVIELQQTASALTIGSVEFLSNDDTGNHPYKLEITPGETGSTQFAFHPVGGTGSTIPYQVRIENTTEMSSSKIRHNVLTYDVNGNWHDFINLEILNFNTSATYAAGNYQSRIMITLIRN